MLMGWRGGLHRTCLPHSPNYARKSTHLNLNALVKVHVVLPAVLGLVRVGEAGVKGHRLDVLRLNGLGARVKVLGHGDAKEANVMGRETQVSTLLPGL